MANYIIFAASVRILGGTQDVPTPRLLRVIIMTFLIACLLGAEGLGGIVRFYEIISLIKFIPFFSPACRCLPGGFHQPTAHIQASPLRMASGPTRLFLVSWALRSSSVLLYVSDGEILKKPDYIRLYYHYDLSVYGVFCNSQFWFRGGQAADVATDGLHQIRPGTRCLH